MPADRTYIGSPDNPRTAGTIAYITFIGWLIAYFAFYRNDRSAFSAFHLRQTLLIHILSFLLKVFYSFTLLSGPFVFYTIVILSVGLFILWLIGFIDAMNGRERPVPVIGRLAQVMFRSL